MRTSTAVFLSLFGVITFGAGLSRADEAADKKAELQKKKEEAKKRAAERKALADKAAEEQAAAEKAAAEKAAAEKAAAEKAAAEKAAAEKAAAEKAAAEKAAAEKAGTGGTAGVGGASSTSSAGAAGKSAGGAASADEKDPALPAGDIEALRKDREERRKASVERAKSRWGATLLADPKGAADLKTHARRVAFLQRARLIADAKKDKKSVELIDRLLTDEDQRHSTAMNSLREGALTVGTSR